MKQSKENQILTYEQSNIQEQHPLPPMNKSPLYNNPPQLETKKYCKLQYIL
jgi:hypothetical protein